MLQLNLYIVGLHSPLKHTVFFSAASFYSVLKTQTWVLTTGPITYVSSFPNTKRGVASIILVLIYLTVIDVGTSISGNEILQGRKIHLRAQTKLLKRISRLILCSRCDSPTGSSFIDSALTHYWTYTAVADTPTYSSKQLCHLIHR